MSKSEIVLITGNVNKVREYERLLGVQLDYQNLDLPEIQATDVRQVARNKAENAYGIVGRPCFVDDTGLTIEAWGQLPGALIRWFLDNVGNEGLLKMLDSNQSRSAYVTTAIGYCDKNGFKLCEGRINGIIANEPKGDNGVGYDTIFIPENQTKTFAEMTNEEKDSRSMRALAAAAMKTDLQIGA